MRQTTWKSKSALVGSASYFFLANVVCRSGTCELGSPHILPLATSHFAERLKGLDWPTPSQLMFQLLNEAAACLRSTISMTCTDMPSRAKRPESYGNLLL